MAEQINTAREVIEKLGGITEVARLLGLQPSAVGNWYARDFPPETFVALTSLLNQRGLYAPPSLWKQRDLAV